MRMLDGLTSLVARMVAGMKAPPKGFSVGHWFSRKQRRGRYRVKDDKHRDPNKRHRRV